MSMLVTGAAGFIGFHVTRRLLERGERVVGLDNLCPYYDPQLKRDRLKILQESSSFGFHEIDIVDSAAVRALFEQVQPKRVLHLAAQAGVRHSIDHPQVYVESNLVGFANVLESCRQHPVQHFLYASSSSVYGANTRTPFSARDNVDHPVSLYAATKKANELMAHSYSHLYGLPTTGLRFFTVYGPWGRPDMAIYRFADAIDSGQPIDIYNRGKMRRDFTYIDDAAECVVRLLDKSPQPDPDWNGDLPRADSSNCPYRVFNLGGNNPVELMHLIDVIESAIGKKAQRRLLPLQLGDVRETVSDAEALHAYIDYQPSTPIEVGVPEFIRWRQQYLS